MHDTAPRFCPCSAGPSSSVFGIEALKAQTCSAVKPHRKRPSEADSIEDAENNAAIGKRARVESAKTAIAADMSAGAIMTPLPAQQSAPQQQTPEGTSGVVDVGSSSRASQANKNSTPASTGSFSFLDLNSKQSERPGCKLPLATPKPSSSILPR